MSYHRSFYVTLTFVSTRVFGTPNRERRLRSGMESIWKFRGVCRITSRLRSEIVGLSNYHEDMSIFPGYRIPTSRSFNITAILLNRIILSF